MYFFKSYTLFMTLIEIPRGHRQIWNDLFTTALGKKIWLITALPRPHWEIFFFFFGACKRCWNGLNGKWTKGTQQFSCLKSRFSFNADSFHASLKSMMRFKCACIWTPFVLCVCMNTWDIKPFIKKYLSHNLTNSSATQPIHFDSDAFGLRLFGNAEHKIN